MIKLFKNKLSVDQVYALSALLFVLGALRIGSALLYKREAAATRAATAKLGADEQ